MATRNPPLIPVVQPAYSRFAKIVDGSRLIAESGKTYADIADACGRHANTISSKYKGGKGEYAVVHDCFTGINVLTGGAFSRREFVKYVDDGGSLIEDLALDQCLVFPKLRHYLRDVRNYRQLGDECGVKTLYIDLMKQGRPVAENLVKAYFDVLTGHVEGLLEEDELFR